MRWSDVPEQLDFETDGSIWASVTLGLTERLHIAVLCTEQHQSIEMIMLRAIRAKIRRFERENPDVDLRANTCSATLELDQDLDPEEGTAHGSRIT